MASWEPVDIDRDGTGDQDYEWGDDFMNDLVERFNQLRQFNKTLDESLDDNLTDTTTSTKDALKRDSIELDIYDKLTISFNNTRKRLGIQKGIPIVKPVRNYDSFKLGDDGEISYIYKRTVINLGNINERLKTPWEIRKLSVAKLRSMGFTNITDEDIQPHRTRYKKAREKIRKLNENLDGRSKEIEYSSTTDAESIEMIEMTSKDIDATIKGVEQDTSFIKPDDRDQLLPLRELEGLDKQLRTIKGS